LRIRRSPQAVQGVVGLRGHLVESRGIDGHAGLIAVAVIAVGRHLAGPAGGLGETVQRVIGAAERPPQGIAGVLDVLGQAVAQTIQGVLDAVAEVVLHGDEPVGGVVGVLQIAAVRQGGPGEITRRVVGEGGGLAIDTAAEQPAAGVCLADAVAAVGVLLDNFKSPDTLLDK